MHYTPVMVLSTITMITYALNMSYYASIVYYGGIYLHSLHME